MYDIILFDFDGTITDTGVGIIKGIRYALERYNIREDDIRKLGRFIGPPLVASFQEIYGFDHKKALEAVDYFREYYSDRGVKENELYEGVRELLQELRRRKKKVMIATSKPCTFVEEIVDQHGIRVLFDFISSASLDETRNQKSDVIRYALEKNGITDPERVLMVGDRVYDVEGARENNIKTAGVLWGYGSRREFEDCRAEYIVEKPEEILSLI